MTLATRCPACGTAFKVVGDQLRVSSGWVRCGRCQASFDALDHLFRREPAPAPEVPAEQQPEIDTDTDTETETAVESVAPEAETVPGPVHEPEPEPEPAPAPEIHPEPEPEPSPERPPEPEPAAAPLGWARDPGFPHVPRPRFVRRAEAAARWSHPATRLALAAFAIVLAALLGAQAGLLWRDSIALHWPASRPLLAGACAVLKCRLDAPRRIEQLSVESSDLRMLVPGSPVYRLDLTLRNRGDTDVLPPAFDLTLTDGSERVLARRVLTLAELGHPARVVAAGSELIVQADLEAGSSAVAGYTIGIFYP